MVQEFVHPQYVPQAVCPEQWVFWDTKRSQHTPLLFCFFFVEGVSLQNHPPKKWAIDLHGNPLVWGSFVRVTCFAPETDQWEKPKLRKNRSKFGCAITSLPAPGRERSPKRHARIVSHRRVPLESPRSEMASGGEGGLNPIDLPSCWI